MGLNQISGWVVTWIGTQLGIDFIAKGFASLLTPLKIKRTKTLHVGYKNKQIKQTKNKMEMVPEVLAGSFKERSKGREGLCEYQPSYYWLKCKKS